MSDSFDNVPDFLSDDNANNSSFNSKKENNSIENQDEILENEPKIESNLVDEFDSNVDYVSMNEKENDADDIITDVNEVFENESDSSFEDEDLSNPFDSYTKDKPKEFSPEEGFSVTQSEFENSLSQNIENSSFEQPNKNEVFLNNSNSFESNSINNTPNDNSIQNEFDNQNNFQEEDLYTQAENINLNETNNTNLENEVTDTSDEEEEDLRFSSKMAAKDANVNPNSKPRQLNKKFILTILICLLGCSILITFLMPAKKAKNKSAEKQVAQTNTNVDYSAYAKRQPQENTHYEDVSVVEEDDDEVEIPPVIEKQKEPYNPQTVVYSNGGTSSTTSSIQIPDTRNDSLQGKTISGIKGLSSTQASYSTDYQQTIANNTSKNYSTNNYSLPTKEEFINNAMSAYTNANATQNSYSLQNDQTGKNNFFNNGRNSTNVGTGEWLNLNTLWQGTIFEAVLTSELNTDLPGECTARIAKNIYSSQDGRYLLVPQNSIVYGTYNSSISYSQNRVQVAWHTLIRPDGYQIQLGNMNATDAKGASGLKGFVNDHPLAYLKAIGLMSVFSIVNSEFTNQMGNTQNQYIQNLLANSQSVTMELGEKLIDRAMNVQPTIKIKAGTKINIVVNQNLSLPPCEDIPVTQPYRK